MVDEKLDDQVWVTVVATGYGDEGRRKSVSRLESRPPARSGSSARRRQRAPSRPRRAGLAVDELECPSSSPTSERTLERLLNRIRAAAPVVSLCNGRS